MGILKRSKNGTPKRGRDGPAEWASRAREVDAEVKRQRLADQIGDKAIGSAHQVLDGYENGGGLFGVQELSEANLRRLYDARVRDGKFIRIGDKILLAAGGRRGFEDTPLIHREILEQALKKEGSEPLVLTGEEVIGAPDFPLTDAGKFGIFLSPEGKTQDDGTIGRFRIFGASGDFLMAGKEGRAETVRIASDILGERFRTEEEPDKF